MKKGRGASSRIINKDVKNMKKQNAIENASLIRIASRSAWQRGVADAAISLLEDFEGEELPTNVNELEKVLLNGCEDWKQYSYYGNALCYNYQIAKRYCTPSEYKRKKEGALPPNKTEDWLDIQARALYQAFRLIKAVAIDYHITLDY